MDGHNPPTVAPPPNAICETVQEADGSFGLHEPLRRDWNSYIQPLQCWKCRVKLREVAVFIPMEVN